MPNAHPITFDDDRPIASMLELSCSTNEARIGSGRACNVGVRDEAVDHIHI